MGGDAGRGLQAVKRPLEIGVRRDQRDGLCGEELGPTLEVTDIHRDVSFATTARCAALAVSACSRLRSRVRSTTRAAIRRAIARKCTTGAAGGTQRTNGMRTAYSRSA